MHGLNKKRYYKVDFVEIVLCFLNNFSFFRKHRKMSTLKYKLYLYNIYIHLIFYQKPPPKKGY